MQQVAGSSPAATTTWIDFADGLAYLGVVYQSNHLGIQHRRTPFTY
jgi:hypothetical protein